MRRNQHIIRNRNRENRYEKDLDRNSQQLILRDAKLRGVDDFIVAMVEKEYRSRVGVYVEAIASHSVPATALVVNVETSRKDSVCHNVVGAGVVVGVHLGCQHSHSRLKQSKKGTIIRHDYNFFIDFFSFD